MSLQLSKGCDVVLYTSRGVPLQTDGAKGLLFGERVGAALVRCVAGITERPRFMLSKGGITSSDIATKGLGMTRAEVGAFFYVTESFGALPRKLSIVSFFPW